MAPAAFAAGVNPKILMRLPAPGQTAVDTVLMGFAPDA